MAAEVLPWRRPQALITAREVIRRPDDHDEAVVLDACDALIAGGDWMDHSRATELRRAIVRATVDRINARAARQQRGRRIARSLALVALGLIIGLCI